MLPVQLEDLVKSLKRFPGLGLRSSQKLALDILQMSLEDYQELAMSMEKIRRNIGFCTDCGFFADKNENSEGLCAICSDNKRNLGQICLVEKPTDIISVEKSESYFGKYHVLNNLISPLENIFVENTNLDILFEKRIPELIDKKVPKIELIVFFKAGFSSEATIAYIKERIKEKNYQNIVNVSRLAQGLPLYYNPDTLDSATMTLAISDRKNV